ncbi:MAG: putative LPS assembly protein LptD, partial [Bacteroidota bacterium]|nr:putative LPS assembly protein LptD [Bacteroidota bacterium]
MRFLPIIVFILSINAIFAQKIDSTAILKKDSASVLIPDTLLSKKDSVKTKKFDVDTVIYAQSTDSIIYYIEQRKMDIYGKGQLQYKDTDLKSANIFVDFNTNFLHAEGTPSDTAVKKFIDTPVLKDKGEGYEGIKLKYNFKTLQGFITEAQTETDGAFYTGEKINKVTKDVFFIKDGEYTTCNLNHPHYNFYASSMKVINKDQIIARWIWLYFGGVPLPVPIPFAVFPVESGRRSGILPPAFGDRPGYGKYFSRFGYFWAISDYMDVNFTGDYYTRGSYNAKSLFRYAKRYDFTGQLEVGYSDMIFGEPGDPDLSKDLNWSINWVHNQRIDPTTSLNANVQFISGKNYTRQTSTNINDNLNRNIISNITFFKSWEESGNSLSLSYSRNQDLDNGTVYEVLPNLTFNKSQTYPFKKANSTSDQKWYELIGFNYSSEFRNTRNKVNDHLDIKGGIQHSFSTSFSPKFGYFNLTPNFSFSEKWYNKQIKQYMVKSEAGKDS